MTETQNVEAVSIRTEAPDAAVSRWCLEQYFADLDRLFDGGFDVRLGHTMDVSDMMPPRGLFAVAWRGESPMGCGVLLRLDDTVCEIKRMWVRPEARGQGLSRLMLRFLEDQARQQGFARVRLDTNKALVMAQDMYRRAGYRAIARYNDNPYAHCWFEKDL